MTTFVGRKQAKQVKSVTAAASLQFTSSVHCMQGQWATINIRDVSTGGSNSNALQLQHTADGTNWVGVMNLTLSNVQGARMFQIGAEGEYRVGSDATTTNTAVVHFIVGGHSPFDY